MDEILPNRLSRRYAQNGVTLVEILVVLAIIAAIAAIIYPTVIDSFKKSQATMVTQRIDAIQKAKAQYLIDSQTNPNLQAYSSGTTVQITDISPYLVRLGQQVSSLDQLSQGTGGTFNLGTWDGAATFTPNPNENNPYLAQYLPANDLNGASSPAPSTSP